MGNPNCWFMIIAVAFFSPANRRGHGLRTPREEIAFTARPKIHSHSQIFRYGQGIFFLPHWPNFSEIFDLCLHKGVRSPWLWSSSVWPWSSPLAQVGISVCVSGVWAGKATRIFWRSKTLVIWKFKSCNLIALKFKTLDKSKENKNIFEFFKETKSICLFQLLEVESSF